MTAEYTDIVATFTDQLAADKFAEYIAAAGFGCDVVGTWDVVFGQRYGVRVLRSQIADLRRSLNLMPVVNGLTSAAAQIKAGQLAREEIPCYIGGEHSFGGHWSPSTFTLDSITTLIETKESGDMIAVPARLFKKAMRILNQEPISEAELTKLALSAPPDPNDPT